MPTRIALSALSTEVRAAVEQIASLYKIVAVAVDFNTNADYVALVHNRAVHDPFERITLDMPFEISRADQNAVLRAICLAGTDLHFEVRVRGAA